MPKQIQRTLPYVQNLKTFICALVALLGTCGVSLLASDIPIGPSGFKMRVATFFKANCIDCHGPDKSKGKITLHNLNGDFAAGHDMESWEKILKVLESGEMPPEDEKKQPRKDEREDVAKWIDAGLRGYVAKTGQAATVPTTRRLTNFEYQNTMRDLLGFKLLMIKNLPEDPVIPYKFNNTAEYMLLGPEQMDRYKENARRAMASAIVDPGTPKIHKTEKTWKDNAPKEGLASNEIGVFSGVKHSPREGMIITSWPETGEYRIRIKASAKFTAGVQEVPFRLVMGYALGPLPMSPFETVGTVQLRNDVNRPLVFAFRGRVENHPVKPPSTLRHENKVPAMYLTPQNLYDDGTLNDIFGKERRDMSMPRVVVESLEFEAPIADVWPPEHHNRIFFDSPLRTSDPTSYIRGVLKRFITRAYRRPATEEDVARYVKIYSIVSEKLNTTESAMRETLSMVLISPEFLYHTVTVEKSSRQYGLASKLSYFLWGSMPDEELFSLAAQGQLDDPSVIEKQVRRLLLDPRSNDFVENFTTQWLSIDKLKAVKINRALFPRFLYENNSAEMRGTEVPFRPTIRDFMHDETVAFVAELIRRNSGISNIVDSNFACLNQPLAAHYGVDDVHGQELRPVAIKPEHRLGGLLTQGSVLVSNSTGSAPHPIYRAVWLREAILGEEVKPPPADVPSLVDSVGKEVVDKTVNIKELLSLHRKKESCNDCHSRLDPWGIPFEQYSAIGKFQPMVPASTVRAVRGFDVKIDHTLDGYLTYLKSVNTVKVEADSQVPRGPKIDGMQDLKAYLLKDRMDDIAKNILCRLLSYGIGRNLTYRDRLGVETLLLNSKTNGYKIQDMIITICQSQTFRDIHPKGN